MTTYDDINKPLNRARAGLDRLITEYRSIAMVNASESEARMIEQDIAALEGAMGTVMKLALDMAVYIEKNRARVQRGGGWDGNGSPVGP